MPRLSNNGLAFGGGASYQRRQVDNEVASASNGMRMRQRGTAVRNTRLDAWLHSLRWPDALAGAERCEFQDPSPLGFLSPAQEGRLSFSHGTLRSPPNPPEAKSRHG